MHRRQLLTILILGLILTATRAGAEPAVPPPSAVTPQTPGNPLNARSPLGTNLGKIGGAERIWFTDQFRRATSWLTQCDDTCNYIWDTNEQDQLVLDENGWVISFGTNPNRQFTHIGTYLYVVPALFGGNGQWTVLYDGEATFSYGFDPLVQVISRAPGRDVLQLNLAEEGLLYLRIDQINPNNHLRNVRILPPGGICNGDPFAFAPDATGCAGSFQPFEAIYQTHRFHPLFLQDLRPYRALRTMQFQGIVEDLTPKRWDQRSHLSDAIWAGGWADGSPPQELIFELANLLLADPWVHLPFYADDDYVRQFAQMALAQAAPTLHLYVEFGNEFWNDAYPYVLINQQVEALAQARWPADTAPNGDPISGYTKRMNYVGMRSAQICRIWKEVWGSQADRVRCVMPGGPWDFPGGEALACPLYAAESAAVENCAEEMYAIAAAPYFGGYLSDFPNSEGGYQEQLLAWTQQADGGLTTLFQELNTGQILHDPDHSQGAIPAAVGVMADNLRVARQYGLHLVAYEGGQHLTPIGPATACNEWNTDPGCPALFPIQNLFIAANRDPRMGELYAAYLQAWRANGGELFMHYTAISTPNGQFGSWGAKEHAGQSAADAPKYAAMMQFAAQNPCWWEACDGTITYSDHAFLPALFHTASD